MYIYTHRHIYIYTHTHTHTHTHTNLPVNAIVRLLHPRRGYKDIYTIHFFKHFSAISKW